MDHHHGNCPFFFACMLASLCGIGRRVVANKFAIRTPIILTELYLCTHTMEINFGGCYPRGASVRGT